MGRGKYFSRRIKPNVFPEIQTRSLRSTGPALFIGALNCRRREGKKDRRNGRKSRKIRPENPRSTPRSYVTPFPLPYPPFFPIRDDCPFIFNEGCLIQTLAQHAWLNPLSAKKRVITIVHFHHPFHPLPVPLPPASFYRSTDQAKRSRHSTSRARDRRASIKRKKDKPGEKSNFRKLTNARIRAGIFATKIGSDNRRDNDRACNQFNFNFALLFRLRGQYFPIRFQRYSKTKFQFHVTITPS